jgi:endonuclease/exonuclease/phosphatase family metal-dependent hydrolase
VSKHRSTQVAGTPVRRFFGRRGLALLSLASVVTLTAAMTVALTGRGDDLGLAAENLAVWTADTATGGRDSAPVAKAASSGSSASSSSDAGSAGPALKKAPQGVAERPHLRRAPQRRLARMVPTAVTFQIGTLNVLGSNHAPGGVSRAAREADLIRARGIDIIGMQEVQRDQRAALIRGLPGYRMWPQDALGRQGYRVQIAYRTSLFEQIDDGGVTHTFDSQRVPIPWVKLRDRATGAEFYVVASHNSPRGMQSQRVASTAIQSTLVNNLKATGLPVLMVGDFNEHQEFFCRISARTQMISANGGRYARGCVAPSGPVRIDWVLGTGGLTRFSGYHQDGTTLSRRLSDHYLIYSTVTITAPVKVPGPAPVDLAGAAETIAAAAADPGAAAGTATPTP